MQIYRYLRIEERLTPGKTLALFGPRRVGKLFGYEMKWKDKKVSLPYEWKNNYGDKAEWHLVNPKNALKFIGIE